jgi:hypothetical protein
MNITEFLTSSRTIAKHNDNNPKQIHGLTNKDLRIFIPTENTRNEDHQMKVLHKKVSTLKKKIQKENDI